MLCAVNFRKMTIVWYIYFTVKMIQNKDTNEDGIMVIPCLVLDGLISGMLAYYMK